MLSELGEEAGGGEMGKEQRNRVAKTTFELAKVSWGCVSVWMDE